MIRFSIFFTLLFATSYSNNLSAQDYTKIDAHARSVPPPKNQDIKALAIALTEGCKTEKEKARSFFVWMAENIHYDVKLLENTGSVSPAKRHDWQDAEQVLKREKGLCEGYTNLFNALCQSVGIQSVAVGGVSRNERGTVSGLGHAWNLIIADGQWGLIDPTWGAGFVDTDNGKYREHLNDEFFFANPEKLLEDHYPNDPLFQCLPTPLSFTEFKSSPQKLAEIMDQKRNERPAPGFEHFGDTLKALFPFDSTEYLFGAGQRSLQINPGSNYGSWALGEYYYQQSVQARKAYFQAIKDLKPVNYYPSPAWFDKQVPTLKNWEAHSAHCLEILKNASGRDDYSRDVQFLRKMAQFGLDGSRKEIEDNKRLKRSVLGGVRVQLMSE